MQKLFSLPRTTLENKTELVNLGELLKNTVDVNRREWAIKEQNLDDSATVAHKLTLVKVTDL
jgi:hypothetical protein